MNKYRLIEASLKIVLWIAMVLINGMYIAGFFKPLFHQREVVLIAFNISAVAILLWYMPSSNAWRILKKGLRYLDRDSDKAVKYLKEYLSSKMITDNERRNGLRILGVAHHKRGDDEAAIECLEQALGGNCEDTDLKVEVLGAIGIICSESGEYQKASEYFDRSFETMFSISKVNISNTTLIQVMNTYIKAGQKEKAVQIYDRLTMIAGFRRNKAAEKLLGI